MNGSAGAQAGAAADGILDARATPWILGALVLLWPLLLRTLGGGDVYSALGPYAALVIVVCVTLDRGRRLRSWGRNLGRDLAIGVAVGAIMTGGTYLAYRACVAVLPTLAAHVEALYRATRTATLAAKIAWTLVVVVAEELLWRGALLDVVARRAGVAVAVALSLGTYVAVQVGTGSWVVPLAALVCGAFWTAERVLTRSIVAPLISHAIWTITVIHLYPIDP